MSLLLFKTWRQAHLPAPEDGFSVTTTPMRVGLLASPRQCGQLGVNWDILTCPRLPVVPSQAHRYQPTRFPETSKDAQMATFPGDRRDCGPGGQ